MKINDVAKLTGVTVRTLHYYDQIGILKPSGVTEAGYRIYDDKDLETLQQIMFFRELDFPLKGIGNIMTDPHYDKREALADHRELLLQKRRRIDGIIGLLDDTLKGERIMSFQEFDMTEIEENKRKYAAEVKERWGRTEAYKESAQKTASYDKEQWIAINNEADEIMQAFADARALSPSSSEAHALVERWQAHITKCYYTCTKEILAGLGQMYIGDKRFTENIDKHGAGTARFMAEAIAEYCK